MSELAHGVRAGKRVYSFQRPFQGRFSGVLARVSNGLYGGVYCLGSEFQGLSNKALSINDCYEQEHSESTSSYSYPNKTCFMAILPVSDLVLTI